MITNRKVTTKSKASFSKVTGTFLAVSIFSVVVFILHNVFDFRRETAVDVNTDLHIIFSKSHYSESIEQASHGKITNPAQKSNFAYVTLISGIDKNFKYRGFLYNTLIMKRALTLSGSTADFIALIVYKDEFIAPYEDDMNLLRTNGIITYPLSRLLHLTEPLSFAEMALLKISPWNFTSYKRIQFFDGDVMPTRNMDCFFEIDRNTFTTGGASPLNSGWYLAIPNIKDYLEMKLKAEWRLTRDWDQIQGWGVKLPRDMKYRGGKRIVKKWDFNGADMDQGLLTHHFVMTEGRAQLLDTDLKTGVKYDQHYKQSIVAFEDALKCCHGQHPLSFFAHFTGKKKPWMASKESVLSSKNSALKLWMGHLDALHLPVNSSTIAGLGLGSPLGFFNSNFPKGGFKTIAKKGT